MSKNNSYKYDKDPMIGRKFRMLTVVSRIDDYIYPSTGKTEAKYRCKCDCGNFKDVICHNLLNGHSWNCGCSNTNAMINMEGKKFGSLTVIKRAPDHIDPSGKRNVMWECKCDCGNTTIVRGHALRNGHTTSCGCAIIKASTIHGDWNSRLYGIYHSMKDRCNNKNSESYKNYGERGITVCDEWNAPNGYVAFKEWAMANGYTDDLSIDRIDNNKGYSPDNCRWVDMKAQANNRRSNNILEYNGESHTVAEWADIMGISAFNIYHRLSLGWDVEKALTTPVIMPRVYTNSAGEGHTLAEWESITGLNRNLLEDRINRNGWSVDKALTTPINDRGTKITYNGITYNLSDWCKALGYAENTISNRLSSGWSVEEALMGKADTKMLKNAVWFEDDNGKPIGG